MTDKCPCGTEKLFSNCCYPIISAEVLAPSPEALMRSRYSAYATKHYTYVANTYAANASGGNSVNLKSSETSISTQDIKSASDNTTWCKLDVLSTWKEKEEGEVEFIAYYKNSDSKDGQFLAMHELSRFVRINNAWFYLDGDMLAGSGPVKLGRNDTCLCGSGKKYKRCCNL
jgi:SEC-C motif-containing protein